MIARRFLGVFLALCVAFAFTAAGEKTKQKVVKKATGCCAEMTKASSSTGKSCNDKGAKGASGECEGMAKEMKVKGGASKGCCDHASVKKVSVEKPGDATPVPPGEKK